MSEQVAPQYRSAGRAQEASGWAVGFIVFVIWALAAHGCDVDVERY